MDHQAKTRPSAGIDGKNGKSRLGLFKSKLPENVIKGLNREIGRISGELTAITNAQFGFLGDKK